MERSVTNPLPKISIVTPSYNQGQFLEETILSVIKQDYPNLEYFIMDGGSTDGSLEIIQKYSPYLAYWESQPDYGQSHAINKGFKKATGELVAWLNSDDLYMPGVLFDVAKIWQEDQSPGFISGVTERIDENGDPTGKLFGSEFNLEEILLTSKNCVAQQSTFINRKALEEVGLLDETLNMSMDFDLWIRIGSSYPVKFTPVIWSQMRDWGNAKTTLLYGQIGSEHIRIVKKYFKGKKTISNFALYRQALAAAHGWSAVIYYSRNDKKKFRRELAISLLHYPGLKGGEASKLIDKAFPVMTKIIKLLK